MTHKTLFIAILAMTCGAALAHGPGKDDKFKMMDTDGNGSISSAEHAAGVTKMFTDMDADKDGFVTATEMDARHAAKGDKAMKMSSTDKIGKMDTDGDGKLSAAEHDAGAAKMFTDMDGDKDGSLSKAEMGKAHGEMKADSGHAGHDMEKPAGTD